jgi:hypothetical protein
MTSKASTPGHYTNELPEERVSAVQKLFMTVKKTTSGF